MEVLNARFLLRRGPNEAWEKNNPILANGEPGFITDRNKLKIGDGVRDWNSLPFINADFSFAPDGLSLAIDIEGQLLIFGFDEAKSGQIPVKSEDGSIEWITPSKVAVTGLLEDLEQKEEVVFVCGGAPI
jgi:hypothetical protein